MSLIAKLLVADRVDHTYLRIQSPDLDDSLGRFEMC
jgi:hypothetical protein